MHKIDKDSNIIKNNKSFFNKKRTIFFSIFFVLTITLMIITLVEILKLNFNLLYDHILLASRENKLFYLSLVILLFSPIIKISNLFIIYYIELKRRGIIFKFWEIFCLTFIYTFIVSITPSAIGGEPWLIYWLRKKGLKLNESSAFVLYSSTISHLSATIITWPSFIYFLINIFPKHSDYNFILWFLIIGMSMEFIVLLSFIILSFCPKVQYLISLIFNKILKLLNFKYKSKEEIKLEYDKKKVFTNLMKNYYKIYWFSFFIFISSLINNFLIYVTFYFAINFCLIGNIDFVNVFNAVNISVTANNFIPLPGAEGSLQVLMQKILQISITNISLISINESIFIWRFATNYLTSIIGIIFIFVYLINILIVRKNNKLNSGGKNNKILLIHNRSHNTIGGIETYNKNLIEIFTKNNYDVHELTLVHDSDVNKNKFLSPRIGCKIAEPIKNKYHNKTKWFEKIDESNPLKQFLYMRRYIKYSRKLVRNHLIHNSYDLIIDSSFFGFDFLFNNPHYVWIQHNSKKSRNGMIYGNLIMNILGYISTKIMGVKNTFKFCRNVILYDKYNEKDIGYKHKHFYKIPLFYDKKMITKINAKSKNKIVFISRLEKNQKRCDLLIKIAKYIKQPIYVYGQGQYEDEIKKTKNLIYCNKFNHNEIRKIFKDKIMTVILSNHEGFSFVAVESLSNATPLIVRDTFPSAKFFVDNEKNGVLLNRRTKAKKIAKIINEFYSTLSSNSKYFDNALKFANKNFKYINFKNNWLNIVEKLSK